MQTGWLPAPSWAVMMPKQINIRAAAAECLHQVLTLNKSLQDALPAALQDQPERDKAWLQQMVYGVLRNLPLLQFWLNQLLSKPLKNKQKVVEQLIMLGFYQIAFSRVSQHAAVSETVEACKQLKQIPLKGLVNGILRNFIRDSIQDQLPDDPRIKAGLPKWLYNKLQIAYPHDFDDIVAAQQSQPPIWLRINLAKTNSQEFIEALGNAQIDFAASTGQPWQIKLLSSQPIEKLPGYDQGWFSVQDAAAQLAAIHLDPQPGDNVLDACAAPGGKTAHIFERQPELGSCLALDSSEKRLQRLRENLARLGHTPLVVSGDAASPKQWWDGQPFQRILLDAPCSATGIIRRHPDIPWLRKADDIRQLVELQKRILDQLWEALAPGGVFVYATCSILPEENRDQIEAFLQRHSDAEQIPLHPEQKFGQQIIPGENDMDGFYYAKLVKLQ